MIALSTSFPPSKHAGNRERRGRFPISPETARALALSVSRLACCSEKLFEITIELDEHVCICPKQDHVAVNGALRWSPGAKKHDLQDAEAAARFYAETFSDSMVSAVHRAPSDYPSGQTGCMVSLNEFRRPRPASARRWREHRPWRQACPLNRHPHSNAEKPPWEREMNSQVATSNQHYPGVDVSERSTVS